MSLVPASRAVRLVLLAVLALGLVGGGVWAYGAARDSGGAEVVDSSAPEGWQTIEYRGVRVEIPEEWERLDLDGCEFRLERWGPAGADPCDGDARGVSFYGSATFDPATGPGVRRSEGGGAPVWAGYVYAGDFAVYAADDARSLVRTVLRSARVTDGDSH